ncbi:GntR family transcriptional regulator [Azohydromonas aeria]|uniref:GntR family transcriptional regulator n=1 Tax=Azohydromonas aeria TaxID=2590212 RepID=UPI001E5D707F|nr:GntR family transcriptional regulator [Azohydromonas aeria]
MADPGMAGAATHAPLSDAQIHDRIVDAILDHQLLPGTRLAEDKLGQAFGVSRTRIRQVLIRLAHEQIVTLAPHRGASVATPDPAEAREVFEVRRMVEPLLVQRFMRHASAGHLGALASCLAQEEAARAAGERRRAIRLSGEFHLRIADGAAHRTLGRVLRELVSRTSLVLMTYGAGDGPTTGCGCADHRALLAAIRLRDEGAAAALMTRHLEEVEQQLRIEPPATQAPDFTRIFGAAAASPAG